MSTQRRQLSFWDRAERFSPILCRLLARHKHGPPLTDLEISVGSGLSLYQIATLSQCTSWDGIDIPTTRRFLVGCRVDFEDYSQMNRVREYLRRKPTFKYLRTSKGWRTFYEPMILRWKDSILAKMPPSHACNQTHHRY